MVAKETVPVERVKLTKDTEQHDGQVSEEGRKERIGLLGRPARSAIAAYLEDGRPVLLGRCPFDPATPWGCRPRPRFGPERASSSNAGRAEKLGTDVER